MCNNTFFIVSIIFAGVFGWMIHKIEKQEIDEDDNGYIQREEKNDE